MLMRRLFDRADYMPSFTEKRAYGTVRLHFRRRLKAESNDLIIVRVSGAVLRIESQTDSNCTTVL